MNNPLNRRMFRQSGMSKQPMGILASSPELMTTAQKAMMKGQPIKAQNAVSVNLNRPLVASDFVNIAEKIKNPNSILNVKSREMSKMAPTLPNVSKITEYIGNVFSPKPNVKSDAEIKTEKLLKEKNAPDPMEATTISEYINKSIAKQKIIDKENKKANPNYYSPLIDDKEVTTKKVDTKKIDDKEVVTKENIPPETKLFPGTKDATDKDSGASLSAMIDDIGNIDKIVDDQNKKVTNFNNENILNKINEVTSNDKDNVSAKAKKLDKLFGIESLKDKIKAREAILDEIMGSTGSDVRTDPAYVTMMTGLLIAAGQDPNALTNIAQGAAKGLLMYGEAAGEDLKERKKIKLVAAKLGFQAQATEDAKKAAANAATIKFGRDIILENIKAGLGKDKAILGLVKSFASNQNIVLTEDYIKAAKNNEVDKYLVKLATDIYDSVTQKEKDIVKSSDSAGIDTSSIIEIDDKNQLQLPPGYITRIDNKGVKKVIKASDKDSSGDIPGIPVSDILNNYKSTNKLPDFDSLFTTG